ncbi:MAG: response regulator [Lentimicrobiaceae bacterium]|jgi:CheY-like chemotaxis protein|nr:response regulator [Lentimicrobiaceae bacterium]
MKSKYVFNVLIVDDRPENLLSLEGILENEDLNIIKANSGNEALGIMLEQDISLVLLDVQMPGIDGFEVAKIMRSSERTKYIPIIFITAISKQRQHIFKGYETGAVDYLYKPLDLEILQSKIKAFIEFFQHKNALEETTKMLEKTVAELNAAKKIAEEATLAKSAFLATMSHEIRTPLNGIIGMADLGLMDEEMNTTERERLTDIKTSGESLLDIINEILDISKIEADKLELEEIEFSIREVISKIVNLLSIKIFQEKLEFVCDIDPKLPDILIGDPLRIRQILINLLSNAAKFTKEGKIVISIKMLDHIEEQISLEFSVQDSGIGIAEENIDKLFQSYSQVDASTARNYGGTGLGLNISQKLVRLMGGQIKVESEYGKGSRFYFRLNMITGTQETKPWEIKLEKTNANYNFLIIDSHDETSRIIGTLLNTWGIKNKRAKNLNECKKLIVNNDFDMILIDYFFPEMNGNDLANKIKQDLIGKHIPKIVLLSPSKATVEVLKIKKSRKYEFLTKPVLQNELKTLLEKNFASKEAIREGQLVENNIAQQVENKKTLHILIAEDQLINRKIIIQLLEKKGWEITAVENGKLAVDAYMNSHYDLIFMDVQMPEMDGFVATQKIREAEDSKDYYTPIIAMTAHAMKGDRERCLAAGMDFYITKPVNPTELYETVEKFTIIPN